MGLRDFINTIVKYISAFLNTISDCILTIFLFLAVAGLFLRAPLPEL